MARRESAGGQVAMVEVTLYTTRYCPFCVRAKMLLEAKKVPFTEVAVDHDPAARQVMMQRSGRHTVPQIWIGDEHIGGCDELFALEQMGQLNQKLGADNE